MKKYFLIFLLFSASVAGAMEPKKEKVKTEQRVYVRFIKALATFILEPIYNAVVNYHENFDEFSKELSDTYFQ